MPDRCLSAHRNEGQSLNMQVRARFLLTTTNQDFIAAAKLLEPLCEQEDGSTSPHMQSAVARIYLQGGYVEMAVKHFSAVVQDPTADAQLKTMNAALLAAAEGDWQKADQALKQVLQVDPENYLVSNVM